VIPWDVFQDQFDRSQKQNDLLQKRLQLLESQVALINESRQDSHQVESVAWHSKLEDTIQRISLWQVLIGITIVSVLILLLVRKKIQQPSLKKDTLHKNIVDEPFDNDDTPHVDTGADQLLDSIDFDVETLSFDEKDIFPEEDLMPNIDHDPVPEQFSNPGRIPEQRVADPQMDSVQAKLDMAVRHVDTGDYAKIEEILEEVINEADAKGQAKARAILQNIEK
jgi:FimV-like protein